MTYLSWAEKNIADWSDASVESLYNEGYVFTRIGKGVMQQTRSVRVDLSKFSPSSENRRILKKNEGLALLAHTIPFEKYDWAIGKMGKDFYEKRSAEFTANKIKELITDAAKSNFNTLLSFTKSVATVGYAICRESANAFHYCYPFHDDSDKDLGLGMMLLALEKAKDSGKKYFYIGSLQRPSDAYKLQFEGVEWFDGKTWLPNVELAKNILKNK